MRSGIFDIIDTAANRYGEDPDTLRRFAKIESNFNPLAISPTGAEGLFQFTSGTAKQYGLVNRRDPAASADAAARLLRDNKASLRRAIGREPRPGELYLAHQQGPAGAAALIAHPDENVVDALAPVYGGDRAKAAHAIKINGGSLDMTAGDFARGWVRRFGGNDAKFARSDNGLSATTERTRADIYNEWNKQGFGAPGLGLGKMVMGGEPGGHELQQRAPAPGLMSLRDVPARAPETAEQNQFRYVAMTPAEYRVWLSERG